MKTVSISGSTRESVGKKDAKQLRREELIPCVIYGGKEQIHFYAAEKAFKDLIYTPNVSLVKLDINGKEYDAIIQDSQFHAVNDSLLHVDFLEISDKNPIKINIPVSLIGTAEGVKAGGALVKKTRLLKVKGYTKDLPDTIEINVEKLGVGQIIRVRDIATTNITLLDTPSNVVATVKGKRGMEAATTEAAAPAKKK